MLKNLMFATIYVSDQNRALAFYTDRLGLEKGADSPTPEGRFLTVAPADKSVQIVLWPGKPGQPGPAVDAAVPGIMAGAIFLEADDLRKEVQSAPISRRRVRATGARGLLLRRPCHGAGPGR
jgi:catechol 2,3-dioxygenase-like lactoylglutathione lyase family enzyme